MTQRKIKTALWIAAGLLLSISVLLVVFSGLSGKVLIWDAEGITEASDAVMTAIRNDDWNTLKCRIANAEDLTPPAIQDQPTERKIWDAYRQSLQWKCSNHFDINGAHITQKITVTCLDISAVTYQIAQILQVEPADSLTREQLLLAAADKVLMQELPLIQKEITLHFERLDGTWKVVPNNALLKLLSGFTVA